jgi:lipopolysaccharide/colanic/teichoic acid biosynthesis glycosyltransferase/nucleoside-diphosphate-sugar epimerase
VSETVLVVGASGFVGRAVVNDLLRRGMTVHAAARRADTVPPTAKFVPLPDLTQADTNWSRALEGADQVVYLAARVHVMNDTHPDPLAAYRAVNRDAALALATTASQRGLRRFVYMSSVKVNGESSTCPLTETDLPAPTDAYGISKLEAEQALLHLGEHSGLEVVIIRPPLVYGPGVKANFMALARAAGRGLPLPIGAVVNWRSMIYVENLTDLIALTLQHPAAAGQVFFASDGQDLSTPELTRRLAEAQGRTPLLPAVPVWILDLLGRVTGRQAAVQRLTGSLQVSSEKARTLLSWTPPFPVWQALARTGASVQASPVQAFGVRTTGPVDGTAPYQLRGRQRFYLKIRAAGERVAAAGLLAASLPISLGLALLIRLDSPGPVLFVQRRAGHFHQPFDIYKFRTMRVGTPSISTEEMQRSGLDPVTRVGRFLRRTSLDELPQLLNVLRGEMSLVGPRPALMTQTRVLRLREAAGVDQLIPGVTGYAQVTGRDDLEDEEKVQRDAQYLHQLSFRMDLEILGQTFSSVFKGTGTK